ncbi:MAG TPA: AI-2E family transporter [Acidimicrobiales bacterium]|nr:AI-2E family transporter [Acidimicrobiales bacterium]
MNAERLRRAGSVAWAVVGVAAVVAIGAWLVWQVRVIFPPLILAGAIVFLLNPIVTLLQHRGLPRAAGAGLSYLLVLAIIAMAGIGLYPLLAGQIDELADEWPAIQTRVENFIDDRAADSEGTFFEFSREDIEDALSNTGGTFEEQLKQAREIGAEIFHVLLILILGPIIAFYLLVDIPHLRRVALDLIPEPVHDEVLIVGHRLNRAIGGFFRGQLMVALIVGILCSIGLGIIQLKFWFLIGMIAGLFNVIPLIGPWVGGVPGVTIALTTGSPVKALLVIGIMVGVQQIDNHFITPYVMQRAVQLHPAAVILALVAGGSLGGFAGLLLAVPTAAVLKILISHLWHTYVLGRPVVADDLGPGPVEDVDSRPENQGDDAGSSAAASATPDGEAAGDERAAEAPRR